MTPDPYDVSPVGEGGLMIHGAGPVGLGVQKIIWQLATQALGWSGVFETVIGVNNLLVIFDPEVSSHDRLAAALAAAWHTAGPWDGVPACYEVPVDYGAPESDLADVALLVGLSEDEVIRRHTAGQYTVLAVGSQPGYAYLAGMDETISVPRRVMPRPKVRKGSVIIGGAQTAVATLTSPSGWSIIGHTDAEFFDVGALRPAKLKPGDQVRFLAKSAS